MNSNKCESNQKFKSIQFLSFICSECEQKFSYDWNPMIK